MKTAHLKRKRSWLRPSKRHSAVCNRFVGLSTWIYHQRVHKRLQTTTPSVARAATLRASTVPSLPTGYRAMARSAVRTLFPFLCMEAPSYFLRYKLGRTIPLIPRKTRDIAVVVMKSIINMVSASGAPIYPCWVLFPRKHLVRRSGRGTVHWRPHKIFLHFHQLWTLLNKIREGVALSPLRIFYKTHSYAN